MSACGHIMGLSSGNFGCGHAETRAIPSLSPAATDISDTLSSRRNWMSRTRSSHVLLPRPRTVSAQEVDLTISSHPAGSFSRRPSVVTPPWFISLSNATHAWSAQHTQTARPLRPGPSDPAFLATTRKFADGVLQNSNPPILAWHDELILPPCTPPSPTAMF